jgi:hypothetical protein
MKAPARSTALANAVTPEFDGLPADFAAHVAALAEDGGRQRRDAHRLVLPGAFVAMLGVCVAGWFAYGSLTPLDTEWLGPLVAVLRSQPWLTVGISVLALVQALNFGRRAMT